MGRGTKLCKCGAANGPRSFFCKVCKEPFTIKGVVSTEEKRAELEQKRLLALGIKEPEVEEVYLNIYDYFDDDEPTKRELELGGEDTQCFISKNKKYRVRFAGFFMGIPLEKLHNRWYTLLKKNDDIDSSVKWDLIRRFDDRNKLLHFYKSILDGTREVKVYVPGDDVRKNRALKRFNKKKGKLAKQKSK